MSVWGCHSESSTEREWIRNSKVRINEIEAGHHTSNGDSKLGGEYRRLISKWKTSENYKKEVSTEDNSDKRCARLLRKP